VRSPGHPDGQPDEAVASTVSVPAAVAHLDGLPVVDARRYRMGPEIGRGGLGRVSRAEDLRFGRDVAIKELAPSQRDGADLLLREAVLTAQLQHPGVAPIYDAGYWPDGSPFYAMKIVEGRPLSALIGEATTLAARLALLPSLIAVAETVAYAHTRGVVHRDLKPSNVVVGAFGETVVIDWGIAGRSRATLEAPASSTDTVLGRGGVAGTPGYMAPEQARGEPIDRRADVYALGATLVHVLTGRPPTGPAPLALPREVPPDLAALAEKALAADAAARYPDAGALADDLKRFQTGQLVGAHHYGRAQLLARWVRRRRAVLTVAGVLLAALAIVGAISLSRIISAQRRDAARTRVLTILQARSELGVDPSRTIAWLKALELTPETLPAARVIALGARSRGISRRVLRAHANQIAAAALAPDGRTLATAGLDRGVTLIDVATGRIATLDGHRAEVMGVAWSPDGARLWTAANDETARAWSRDGRELLRVEPGVALAALAVSPRGDRVATGGLRGRLDLWSDGGAAVGSLSGHRDLVHAIAFSPDGARLASLDAGGEVWSWDTTTRSGRKLDAPPCSALAFLGDGRLATGHGDGLAAVWDAGSAARLDATHLGEPVTALLDGGGGTVMVAGTGGALRRWRGGAVDVLAGAPSMLHDLAAVDGDRVAAAAADGSVRVYDFRRRVVTSAVGHRGTVRGVTVAAGGELLSAGSDGTVRWWSVANHPEMLGGGGAAVQALAVAGSVVAVARSDGIVEVVGGRRLAGPGAAADVLALARDGAQVAWATEAGLQVAEVAGGAPRSCGAREGALLAVSWSPDGRMVASAGQAGDVEIFDAACRPLQRLRGHVRTVGGLAWSPDARSIASVGRDRTVRLWDVVAGSGRVLGEHDGFSLAVAFSPDGRSLASVGADAAVRLWRLDPGAASAVLGHQRGTLTRLAFSRDGRTLVTGGRDLDIGVWDPARGSGRRLTGHTDRLAALAISPDGRILATSSFDGSVRLWDVGTGESAELGNAPDGPAMLAFSDDGSLLVTAGGDGTVRAFAQAVPGEAAAFRGWLDDLTSAEVTSAELDGR
jgi:WD40 repeat protein